MLCLASELQQRSFTRVVLLLRDHNNGYPGAAKASALSKQIALRQTRPDDGVRRD
jgi:hypothetical protein